MTDVFKHLSVEDLCSCALTSRGWYHISSSSDIWAPVIVRRRRIFIKDYPPIQFWNPFSVFKLLRMSVNAQDIRAYDFFNCQCALSNRLFNKRWFGHKHRRKQCECATLNNRLGWLVVFLLCMEYLLYLSDSIGTIWNYTTESTKGEWSWLSYSTRAHGLEYLAGQSGGRLSYPVAALSTAFSVVGTGIILFLVLALKWYMSNPLYMAFFMFACSLIMSAGQYVSIGFQVFAILNALTLLYHLLSSKTDHGYKYQLLVEMTVFHCIVKVQWILFQLPPFTLPLITLSMMPFTVRLGLKAEYVLGVVAFGSYNFIWLTSLGAIQHLQVVLGIAIPQALTTDVEFWVKVIFMPVLCMQTFLQLDSTDQQERLLGITVLQKYSVKFSHMAVFWLTFVLVLLAAYQLGPVIALIVRGTRLV